MRHEKKNRPQALSPAPQGQTSKVPDPEVSARPARRTFTAEYKLRILQEADACTESGQIGALLRREGLYSSHLTDWRRERELAELSALAPRKRGRKKAQPDPLARDIQQLKRELERTRRQLETAQTIIAFQKKVSDLLGIELLTPENDDDSSEP